MNSRVDKHKTCAPPTHFTWRLCCNVTASGERYPQMSLCVLTPVLTSMHSIIQPIILCECTFLDSWSSKPSLFPICLLFDPVFQPELTIFPDRTLSPSSDISILVCLWFHKILCVLLPILWVSYCPFCLPLIVHPAGSVTAHPAGSATAHSAGLLLAILRVLLPILLVYYNPFCVSYCPFCGSVTGNSVGLLLSILWVCYCPFCVSYCSSCGVFFTAHSVGLLLPILRLLLPMLRTLLSILRVCYCPFCSDT